MIELLIATVNQKNLKRMIEVMNINSNCIIANQVDNFSYLEEIKGGNLIKMFNFNERGVGLNRNNALLRAKGDICIIGDDDIYYYDNYALQIEKAFKENPKADVIIFNLDEEESKRYKITKKIKINHINFTKFGAARIAFKRRSILNKRITFSTLFGGGAIYSAGEDTLFLKDCLNAKLVMIGLPITLGKLKNDSESTWFNGYNEKLIYDTGACFSELFRFQLYFRMLYFALKQKKEYKKNGISFSDCIKLLMKGKKDFGNAVKI